MDLCYLTNSGGDRIVPTSDSVGILRDFGLPGCFFFIAVVKNNLQGHQSNKTAKGGG